MSEQQHGQPSQTVIGSSAGRDGNDPGTAVPIDGDVLAPIHKSSIGQPSGEAREAIERATAVVGDDEGDAS